MRSSRKKVKPSKNSIDEAMKLPQGEKIRNGNASLGDWLTVIYAAEAFEEMNEIIQEECESGNEK